MLTVARPEAVVQVAAVVSSGRPDPERSFRVNVQGTETFARAAAAAGAHRWLQISSMSAHPANKSVYGASKLAQEDAPRGAGFDPTVFRPSLIYGPQRRGIFHKLVTLLNQLPIVPLVGAGGEPMRPVHVDDMAAAASRALANRESEGKTYELGGPEDWTFRHMIEEILRMLGKSPRLVPVPLPVCRVIAAGGEWLLPAPPITTDNVEGVAKARPLDLRPAHRDLGWTPRSFEAGFRECLDSGLLG